MTARRPAPPRPRRPSLAFAHLNLRRNPFGEVTPEERAALAVVDEAALDALAARLGSALAGAGPRVAVQFLGDRGHGKTTHLLALRARFPGAPYRHVAAGERPRLDPAALEAARWPLFLDETQRVPRRTRATVYGAARALVLGAHRDHRDELERAGHEVVQARLRGGLDEARLGAIVRRRIEAARRGPGPVPRLSAATAGELLTRHGDDVRAALHDLYERLQELPGPSDVEV